MSENTEKPIAPYMAIGLSTVVYGIAERKHIKVNLETIEENIPYCRLLRQHHVLFGLRLQYHGGRHP